MSLQNQFSAYWIPLSEQEGVLFQKFLVLFREYNAHTNLSAIRDEGGIIEKHFVDSLMLDHFQKISGRVLDIGSGGGFPGIPLKIMHPDADFTLLDSVGKKVRAMDHFILELGFSGIESIQWRAEEIAKRPEYHRGFDFVLSRATAYLPQILEWSEPFLAPNGVIVFYKLPSEEEMEDGLNMAKKIGLKHARTEKYTLADQERILLFFSRA